MNIEAFYLVYATMLITSFGVTFLVWFLYTAIAPWYKTSAGRYIWGLLLACLLVLSNSVVRIVFGAFPLMRELAVITLFIYIVAVLMIGVGIYRVQIRYYRRMKAIKKADKES